MINVTKNNMVPNKDRNDAKYIYSNVFIQISKYHTFITVIFYLPKKKKKSILI